MNNLTQVIAAVSTPPGKGGVAIIRMSGVGAFEIVDKVFSPVSGKKFSECTPRLQIYGHIVENGEKIDDVLSKTQQEVMLPELIISEENQSGTMRD